MRDIFFYELKAVNKAVVELIQSKNCEKEMNDLMTIINRVRELSMVSIKEGPMAMEEVVINNPLNNITSVKYLEETVSHICDGYSAEQLEDYCWTRYFALNLSGFEALQYLVIMRGGLCIQNRDNSYISETEMLAMIPKEIAECYRQNFFLQKNSSTSEIDIREKYYKGELDVASDNEFNFLIKTTDYLFRTLDNRSIQRI